MSLQEHIRTCHLLNICDIDRATSRQWQNRRMGIRVPQPSAKQYNDIFFPCVALFPTRFTTHTHTHTHIGRSGIERNELPFAILLLRICCSVLFLLVIVRTKWQHYLYVNCVIRIWITHWRWRRCEAIQTDVVAPFRGIARQTNEFFEVKTL